MIQTHRRRRDDRVKLLVPQYDLPFVCSSAFGIMMTPSELDGFRFRMRIEPFLIGRKMGYDSKPLTQEDIHRVMTEFEALKQQRPDVVAETEEDMMRYVEWLASPLSSDLTGERAVERALEPIRTIGWGGRPDSQPQPKICPAGHQNPPGAKYCGFCDEPYRFPTVPTCKHCGTVAGSETQKRCHECGASFGTESSTPSYGQRGGGLQNSGEDNRRNYEADDPFAEGAPQSTPSVPSLSKTLRQRWGRTLCDVEPNEVLISSVAVQLGFPNGVIEHNLYLPESREAYEHLVSHFKKGVTLK